MSSIVVSIDADIARIAALRGKTPEDYRDLGPKGIPERSIKMLTAMSGSAADQEAFDDLPEASRRFIAEWPDAINAIAWRSMLRDYDEAYLIKAFRMYWADIGRRDGPVNRRAGAPPRRRLFR